MSIIDNTGWYLIGIGFQQSIFNVVENMIPGYEDNSYNFIIKKAFKLESESTENFDENDWLDVTDKINDTNLIEKSGDFMGIWVFVTIETKEDDNGSNNLINVVPEIFKNKIIDGNHNTLINMGVQGNARISGNLLSKGNFNILDDNEKENDKNITGPLELLNQLKPKEYNNSNINKNEFGFLINDLLKSDISNCIINIDEKTAIDFNNIISLNVAATQELYNYITKANHKNLEHNNLDDNNLDNNNLDNNNLDNNNLDDNKLDDNKNNSNSILGLVYTKKLPKYNNNERNKLLFKF